MLTERASAAAWSVSGQGKVFEAHCLVIDGCYFVRYPTHRKGICTVWSDRKFDDFIIQV